MKTGKKIFDVILIIGFAILAFICLNFAARKIAGQHETKKVALAIADIPAYTEITEDNVNNYFKIYDISVEVVTDNTVTDLTDLVGDFTKEPIRNKEVIVSSSFSSKKDALSMFKDPYEGSFAVSSYSDATSGRVRKGDYVSVYARDDVTGEIVEVVNKLYISGVFDSSGNEIANDDTTTIAVCFNYYINGKDKEELVEKTFGKDLFVVKIK